MRTDISDGKFCRGMSEDTNCHVKEQREETKKKESGGIPSVDRLIFLIGHLTFLSYLPCLPPSISHTLHGPRRQIFHSCIFCSSILYFWFYFLFIFWSYLGFSHIYCSYILFLVLFPSHYILLVLPKYLGQQHQIPMGDSQMFPQAAASNIGTLSIHVYNVNRWNGSNPNVQILPNGNSVYYNPPEFKQHVFAEQGFTISTAAGTHAATYYEVMQISTGPHSGFNVGFSPGFIPYGKSVGECPNSYALQNSDWSHLSGVQHQFQWPFGAIKPEWKGLGDIGGCGLLRSANNEVAIFFTMNGILINAPILISPTVNRLYPTVAIHGNVCVDANFGESLAVKPFKFDIDQYLAFVFP